MEPRYFVYHHRLNACSVCEQEAVPSSYQHAGTRERFSHWNSSLMPMNGAAKQCPSSGSVLATLSHWLIYGWLSCETQVQEDRAQAPVIQPVLTATTMQDSAAALN
jgi:hypothetical protein